MQLSGKSILFLLFAGLLIGVTSPKVGAADYFPLQVGNCWVYYPSYGQGYRIDSIVGTETIGETLTYIWKRAEAPPDNYREKRWLGKDDIEVKVVQYWDNEWEPPLSTPALLDPPWIQDKLNPSVGDSWQSEGDIDVTHFKVTYWVESVTATVTVPAGKFQNCMKVRQLAEITRSGTTRFEYRRYWLAPDVGPVMYRKYTKNWITITKNQRLVAYSLE